MHHRTVLAVKRVEFVSNRMTYIVLRGSWCNIIFLNVRAPNEKSADSKGSFCKKLEQVFNHIFNLTIGNMRLHQDSNDNGVRIVNFNT